MIDSGLHYRELPPPAALQPHVECLWLLGGTADAAAPAHPVLPDGCPELIIQLADPSEAALDDGPPIPQPRAHFVGQLERRLVLRPTGRVSVLGVRFRPAGAAALLREPQWRLRGSWTGLDSLLGKLGAELAEAARNAPDPLAAAALVARRLTQALGPGPDRRIAAAANRLVAAHGRIRIETLAQDAGLGTRQLERGFLRDVGVSPKFLGKILRFQHAFHAIERQPARWAGIAADCGYYDASHLVRDFRSLAGKPPTQLVETAGELTRLFTRSRVRAEA